MPKPTPPEKPNLLHADYSALFAYPFLSAIFGFVLGLLYMIFGQLFVPAVPNFYTEVWDTSGMHFEKVTPQCVTWALYLAGAGLAWALFQVVPPALENSSLSRTYKRGLAQHKKDLALFEKQEAERIAKYKAEYTEAYANYFPKWELWRDDYKNWDHSVDMYKKFWASRVPVAEAFDKRGSEAHVLLARLFQQLDKRARLEGELTDPKHIATLYREVILKYGQTNPELGLLRRYSTAEYGGPYLSLVQDILPPLPSDYEKYQQEGKDKKEPAPQPRKPPAPSILKFYNNYEREPINPPVPPDMYNFS